MERALLKARVSEGLNIKQELCWDEFHCIRLWLRERTVKKREVKRKKRKERESKDDKRAPQPMTARATL